MDDFAGLQGRQIFSSHLVVVVQITKFACRPVGTCSNGYLRKLNLKYILANMLASN